MLPSGKSKSIQCQSRIAVVLVILALLAFTTIRTSPITADYGSGSSLSKSIPKQRHLSVEDFVWTATALCRLAFVSVDYGNVVPLEPNKRFLDPLSGRYFSLPPPIA